MTLNDLYNVNESIFWRMILPKCISIRAICRLNVRHLGFFIVVDFLDKTVKLAK